MRTRCCDPLQPARAATHRLTQCVLLQRAVVPGEWRRHDGPRARRLCATPASAAGGFGNTGLGARPQGRPWSTPRQFPLAASFSSQSREEGAQAALRSAWEIPLLELLCDWVFAPPVDCTVLAQTRSRSVSGAGREGQCSPAQRPNQRATCQRPLKASEHDQERNGNHKGSGQKNLVPNDETGCCGA